MTNTQPLSNDVNIRCGMLCKTLRQAQGDKQAERLRNALELSCCSRRGCHPELGEGSWQEMYTLIAEDLINIAT